MEAVKDFATELNDFLKISAYKKVIDGKDNQVVKKYRGMRENKDALLLNHASSSFVQSNTFLKK